MSEVGSIIIWLSWMVSDVVFVSDSTCIYYCSDSRGLMMVSQCEQWLIVCM